MPQLITSVATLGADQVQSTAQVGASVKRVLLSLVVQSQWGSGTEVYPVDNHRAQYTKNYTSKVFSLLAEETRDIMMVLPNSADPDFESHGFLQMLEVSYPVDLELTDALFDEQLNQWVPSAVRLTHVKKLLITDTAVYKIKITSSRNTKVRLVY